MQGSNYFFLWVSGSSKKESPPSKIINAICDVHTIQPKAVPLASGMLYNCKIADIAKGYVPKPPFEKAITKLPITKAVATASKLICAVSGKAYIVT